MVRLQGAMTALVTPFSNDGAVDVPALKALVEHQIHQGIDGLVACGTTAETPTMDAKERELVIRTVIEVTNGRVPVIAGTGSNNTKATVEATKEAKAWGASAALVVCPYYNKPTQEGLFQHFKMVHDHSGIPVVAYNVPGRTVSDLLPETAARLVEIGAICAIKDATADMARATHELDLIGDGHGHAFSLLSGDDFTILPFVALGGQGVISVVSNIAPKDTSALVKLTAHGELGQARPLHERLVRLTRALFLQSNPIPIKAVMAIAGWCQNTVRLPLMHADEALVQTLREALNTYRGQPKDAPFERFMS